MDDSCELRLTRRFRVTPEELWRAITDPDRVARWLGRPIRFDLDRHGLIEIELPDMTKVTGSVRDVDRPHLLELDWIDEDGESSVVRMKVIPDGNVTLFVLEHIHLPEPVGMRHLGRWESVMGRLAEVVE